MSQLIFFDEHNNIKYLNYEKTCRLDTAHMIATRRLAYPNRCSHLVNEINMSSNSNNEVFNYMIDFLYLQYASRLKHPRVWIDKFLEFSHVIARSDLSQPRGNN